MTAVTETNKKLTKTQKRNRARKNKPGRRRLKNQLKLAKRLEHYKSLWHEGRTSRALLANQFFFGPCFSDEFQKLALQLTCPVDPSLQPAPILRGNPQSEMSGNAFWLNYQSVFQWKDRHMNNVSSYQDYQSPKPPPRKNKLRWRKLANMPSPERCEPPSEPPEPVTLAWVPVESKAVVEATDEEHSSTEEGNFRERGIELFNRSSDRGLYFEGGTENGEGIDGGDGSDDDIVVTEEMMQFLEISIRHKAKREREKRAAKQLERKKRVEERDTVVDCQMPSEEDDNEKRIREIQELYGKQAAKIHGMETALQLNFNRQLDLFNPSYWPFYPFSMQFQGDTALK